MAAAGRGIAGRRFPAVVAAVTAVVDVIALRVVLAVVTKVLRKNGRAPAAQLSRIHGKENTRLRDKGGGVSLGTRPTAIQTRGAAIAGYAVQTPQDGG